MLEGIVLGEILRKLQDISKKLEKNIVTHYDLPKTTVASQRIEKENNGVTYDKLKWQPYKEKEPYVQTIITGKLKGKSHEDFSKVIFPAFCLYGYPMNKVGVIHHHWNTYEQIHEYILYSLMKQVQYDTVAWGQCLEDLYNKVPFSIEKAKIIIKRG
jgi:hypothetical protein